MKRGGLPPSIRRAVEAGESARGKKDEDVRRFLERQRVEAEKIRSKLYPPPPPTEGPRSGLNQLVGQRKSPFTGPGPSTAGRKRYTKRKHTRRRYTKRRV